MLTRILPCSKRYQVATETGCPSCRTAQMTAGLGCSSRRTRCAGSTVFDTKKILPPFSKALAPSHRRAPAPLPPPFPHAPPPTPPPPPRGRPPPPCPPPAHPGPPRPTACSRPRPPPLVPQTHAGVASTHIKHLRQPQ